MNPRGWLDRRPATLVPAGGERDATHHQDRLPDRREESSFGSMSDSPFQDGPLHDFSRLTQPSTGEKKSMTSALVSLAFGMLVPQVPNGSVLGRAPARDKSLDDQTRSLFRSHAPRLTPPDQKDVEVNSVSSADQDETPIRVDP